MTNRVTEFNTWEETTEEGLVLGEGVWLRREDGSEESADEWSNPREFERLMDELEEEGLLD